MMKRTMLVRAALLGLVLVIAGCGSSPRSNHYVLTARQADLPTGDTPSLGIGPIEIPEYLNRNALVYNRKGNQVKVSATERWAEPLEDGLKRVLSLNLAVLVNTQNVRFFPWNAARPPDYGIKVNLLVLDANDAEARLVAEWLVYNPGSGEVVNRRISNIRQALPAGELTPQQVAPAYSDLLHQLSAVIADTITEAETRADRPGS